MDAPRLRVGLLGPLRVAVDHELVEVRGPKRRAILVLLAFAEGRTVTPAQLVDALWPAEPPESARPALHTHLFRLRAQLGPAAARLRTRPDGYCLELDPGDLDVGHARALLETARIDPPGIGPLREAHALWRGPMLSDLTDVAPIAVAVEGCVRLRREVTDAVVCAATAAGEADTVLDLALESLVEDPLREPAVLALMRAHATGGQAPEALRVGREYRRRLAEETGLDPSPALAELERDVAGGVFGAAGGSFGGPRGVFAGPARPARPGTRLIGREAEVGSLHRLLAIERLVSVVGPGGVGKTRLALEVAGGSETLAVLPLAPVTEPDALPHALAAALHLEVARGDVLTACLGVLGDRPGLVVIDNCEHLLDAARDTVRALVTACPRLTVLVTSREPLGLGEEFVSRLAPLPLPAAGRERTDDPSVAVFLERAARVRPGTRPADLATVGEIVRRLDGMPLAIELAAGRLSAFSLADLRDRLDRSLDLLAGGRTSGDARHRTLRATVEWSYRLLGEDEQRLFRHLSVFADGFDLDAGESVAADLGLSADPGTVLARLVDASMVEADLGGPARYRMLDTLRAFGLDRLASAGELDQAESRLVAWAVGLVGWIDRAMLAAGEREADRRLRREMANLRTGWRIARARGLLDDAVAIVTGLFEVVVNRDLIEIRGWAEELAADSAITGHPRRADLLGTAAFAVYHRGDHDRADRLARAGLADGSRYCLHAAAVIALARGAYSEVVELARRADPETYRRYLLGIAAIAKAYGGDTDEARTMVQQGLAEPLPASIRAWITYFGGEVEQTAGRSAAAEPYYARAIADARASGATFLMGVASVGMLSVYAATGREREALAGYPSVIDHFARTGNWTHLRVALRNLADLLRRFGDDEPAAALDVAADADAVAGAGTVLEVARRAIERNLTR